MSAAAQNRLAAIPTSTRSSVAPNFAPSSADSTSPRGVKKGYLQKLGEHHKSWKLRWFVLEGDKLLYFKTADNTKPISYIHLLEAIVRVSHANDKEFTFEVITTNRLYFLSASSYEEMHEWIHCLARKTSHHKDNELFQKANEVIRDFTYKDSENMHTENLKEYEKHAPLIREQMYLTLMGQMEDQDSQDDE